MTITTILFSVVMRRLWGWSWWKAGSITVVFLVVDVAFVGANMLKVPERRLAAAGGGDAGVSADVHVEEGSGAAQRHRAGEHAPDGSFPRRHSAAQAVPGARTRSVHDLGDRGAPPVLLHHLKHNKVLHEKVMLIRCTQKRFHRSRTRTG